MQEDDDFEGGDEEEGETPQEEPDDKKEAEKKAKYVCQVCSAMFKDPGMCPNCEAVLKKKGE